MQSRPRHAPALLLSAIAACAALGLAASPAAAAPLPTTPGSTAASTTSLSDLSDSEQRAAKQLGGDPARAKVLGLNAAATEDPAFYTPPATLPAKNGTVIRKEPATFYLDPLKALKIPGKAERILYRSTDAKGKAIAVSGTVLTPTAAWKGAGDRPIIGYSVGTQGMADRCAPSRQMAVGTEYESLFLSAYLKKGYSVAITDYEGLGTPGTHAYVVSNSAARSALDVVRAARTLKAGGVSDKSKVVLTGYSQGGNGAAAAAEHAPSYAPELPSLEPQLALCLPTSWTSPPRSTGRSTHLSCSTRSTASPPRRAWTKPTSSTLRAWRPRLPPTTVVWQAAS